MRKFKVLEYPRVFYKAHNDVIEHCGGADYLNEKEDFVAILTAGWKELHRAIITRNVTWDAFEFEDENAFLMFAIKYGDRTK